MESVNLLMTCVGGQLSPWLLQSLRRSQHLRFRTIGVDSRDDALGRNFADSFFRVLPGDDPDYPERMLDLCRSEKVDILFPTSDEEALALAPHAAAFAREGIRVSCPPAGMARLMRNKADMYDHLAGAGLALPEYHRVGSREELRTAAEALGYPERPFVLKPTVGRGGRGVWTISRTLPTMRERNQGLAIDALDLEAFLASDDEAAFQELIAMPLLPGAMYDVDVLADADGSPGYLVPRRRYHVRTTPFRGCWIDRNEAVLDLARRTQAILRLPNLFDYDIILDAADRPWLLEVNPRMSASVAVTVLSGVNLLEFTALMLLGREVPQVPIPWGSGGKPYFDLVAVAEGTRG
jgi:carbamoyl-phosphate synthase large subunit